MTYNNFAQILQAVLWKGEIKMNFVKVVPLITLGLGIASSVLSSWASKKLMKEMVEKTVEVYLKNEGKA